MLEKINESKLEHLAIIMDGNSRWAKKNNLPNKQGYIEGASKLKLMTNHILEKNIKYLTIFAFSSENWLRPKEEIDIILDVLDLYLTSEKDNIISNNIKFKFIGRYNNLPAKTLKKIENIETITSKNQKLILNVAFGYGGRQEIVDACKKLLSSKININNLDEINLKNYFYDKNLPDIDFLIRTGGEKRLSNFLLWHLAYSEIYFTDKLWPEFTSDDLDLAIEDFNKRTRNYGRKRK